MVNLAEKEMAEDNFIGVDPSRHSHPLSLRKAFYQQWLRRHLRLINTLLGIVSDWDVKKSFTSVGNKMR